MRTSSQFREDNPDIVYLVYDWNRARADFLTDELGLSLEIADEMNASYENAFRHYRQKTGALVSQAQEIFGIDVGIILENELKIEFDNSYENYESSLRTLLGDANYFKFDNFRESYRRFTAECLGWLPGSVIK